MAVFNATFEEVNGSMSAEFGETHYVSTGNYRNLFNKPSIEGVELLDDKTFKQLGLDTLSVQEIEKILYLD